MPSGDGEISPPTKKDGLSGGAIAGIIIACAVVLAVGGLAVFLFVIKKKTFAEVVAAVKGKFKKE